MSRKGWRDVINGHRSCPVGGMPGATPQRLSHREAGFSSDPEYADLGVIFCKSAAAALHLARHGVKATIERIVSADISAGKVLLSRAANLAADLLVMGVYGHYRVRELLLGGATCSILRSMTLPVLMSH